MWDIDELAEALSDLAGTVQVQGVRIHAVDGELATLIKTISRIKARLTLIEKNWE